LWVYFYRDKKVDCFVIATLLPWQEKVINVYLFNSLRNLREFEDN
jgi:hypothetical protein